MLKYLLNTQNPISSTRISICSFLVAHCPPFSVQLLIDHLTIEITHWQVVSPKLENFGYINEVLFHTFFLFSNIDKYKSSNILNNHFSYICSHNKCTIEIYLPCFVRTPLRLNKMLKPQGLIPSTSTFPIMKGQA